MAFTPRLGQGLAPKSSLNHRIVEGQFRPLQWRLVLHFAREGGGALFMRSTKLVFAGLLAFFAATGPLAAAEPSVAGLWQKTDEQTVGPSQGSFDRSENVQ